VNLPGVVIQDQGAWMGVRLSVVITADDTLVHAVRAALVAVADPEKAGPMQAYMKSAMPFLGVQKPVRVKALRPVFHAHPLPSYDEWAATVQAIWDEARYREERYAAIDLARDRRYADFAAASRSLGLYDHLIVTGAWWDYVDEIAIHLVGPALRADFATAAPTIRQWSRDPDRWRRRASVICQIRSRERTDTDLLTACILASTADTDFFLRKGIGWALREYAKVAPGWVAEFVATHQASLSALSIREATRNLR
jgi:3-methyladenine DNA glycosylase AlkD